MGVWGILLDSPMTQFSFEWILSLNCLCQKWGQVQIDRITLRRPDGNRPQADRQNCWAQQETRRHIGEKGLLRQFDQSPAGACHAGGDDRPSRNPQAQVQLCVVHQVRASLNYVSWKQRKTVGADLHPIYRASTWKRAEQLDEFATQWDEPYPTISQMLPELGTPEAVFRLPG